MNALTICNLTKSYHGQNEILKNLNFVVHEDEIVTIMGKSGSGKTTLLLCILGFITPETGDILLDGKNINALPIEKRQIAYLPQAYALFPHLSVKDNIAFGLAVRKIAAKIQHAKINELLKIVELPLALADRNVEELSGGEKQRVALARALAIEPRLFLFDEPLSAIDVETKQTVGHELRALIKKLQLPAVIITHDPFDAKNLGDTIYHLNNGSLEKRTL